jgi:puromycin-sensitive aminopeptidase
MPESPDDPSSAHRLPYTVEPHRYEIQVAPDLESSTFSGEVRIESTVHETTDSIVLHASELTIESAQLHVGTDAALEAIEARPSLDAENERLVLSSDRPLAPGPITIVITFSGILNDRLVGFYRSTFTDSGGTDHAIATTQFEATDARRAFPCFDEPDRKAVFSVTLLVPSDLAAFSNGPVIEETAVGPGLRRVRFGDTIAMSTYLVAFVVGPLVATDAVDVSGTALRVVHAPGKEDLTAFALEAAGHALTFFTQWFGIDYPAEKLDLVAIPDFAFGAMENLGCITFRENALLVDPARASRLELQRIADVISHEIAHMWFGDLVTMKWWNGIWLNEAFATLMELMCVDHFRPQWDRWVSFGMDRDLAMSTDALHSTRPVEYPVGPPQEAQGMFDVLTYQKGASVLRMLERYLGPDLFQKGIRRYLSDHSFANTETADLWNAIEDASGEPVRDIMDSWILQGGFPLITVEEDDPPSTTGPHRTVLLTQEPFAFAPADGPSAIGTRWRVPVLARSATEGSLETKVLLDGHQTRLALAAHVDGPVVVNSGGSGYYRVRYSEAQLGALAQNFGALVPLERFNLLGDAWAAVVAGRNDVTTFLVLAEALGDEAAPEVWMEVTGPLSFLDRAVDDSVRPVLAEYTRALLRPVFDRLGWEVRPDDGDRTATLRSLVLATLGTVGQDTDVGREAARRHQAALAGGAAVDRDLAGAVVSVVAAQGGPADYEAFLERYRHPDTPQEESRYLYALSGFSQPELAARSFELAVSEVRTQNAPFLVQALLGQRASGPDTWSRVRDNWDPLMVRFPAHIFPRMLDGVKSLCRRPEVAQDVTSFLSAHPIASGQRTVNQIVERLEVNVALATRLRAGVAQTLSAGVARLASH